MLILWQYYGSLRCNGPPLFFVGVVLLLLGALFVALLTNDVYRLQRLATEGLPSIGTVVKKSMHRANDQGTTDTSYEVDYVFATVGGRRLEGTDTVDPATWDAVTEGAQIPVEYAASRPTIQRIGDRVKPPIGSELGLAAASILGLCGAALAVQALRMSWSPAHAASKTDSNAVLAGSPGPGMMKILAFLQRWVNPLNVFALVMLFMGALFLAPGLGTAHQESQFRREGETVSATVLTKSSRYEGQGRGSGRHYRIGYRFVTHDGISVEGSDQVTARMWGSIRERESIPIVYLSDRPQRNRLVANDPGRVPADCVLGAAFLGAGALLVGCMLWGSMRRRRERYRHGPDPRFSA
jgi:hypothetical protein